MSETCPEARSQSNGAEIKHASRSHIRRPSASRPTSSEARANRSTRLAGVRSRRSSHSTTTAPRRSSTSQSMSFATAITSSSLTADDRCRRRDSSRAASSGALGVFRSRSARTLARYDGHRASRDIPERWPKRGSTVIVRSRGEGRPCHRGDVRSVARGGDLQALARGALGTARKPPRGVGTSRHWPRRVGRHVHPHLATAGRCRSRDPQVTFRNAGPSGRPGPAHLLGEDAQVKRRRVSTDCVATAAARLGSLRARLPPEGIPHTSRTSTVPSRAPLPLVREDCSG
jgi:hypothetical protein